MVSSLSLRLKQLKAANGIKIKGTGASPIQMESLIRFSRPLKEKKFI